MKCDELKSLWVYSRDIDENSDDEFVNFAKENGYEELVEKKEVTEAIAELKEFAENACLERDDNQTAIDELQSENRKLQSALWIARAERYKMKEFIAREEGNLSNQMSWSRVLRERTYNQWVEQLLRIANLANKLQNKCRAKAEEYK